MVLQYEVEERLKKLVFREKRPFVSKYWWLQRPMHWMRKNEELRTQLLWFLDVFPALKTNKDIYCHMKDILVERLRNLPFIFRAAYHAGEIPVGMDLVARVVRAAIHLMGNRFMIAMSPDAIQQTVRKLHVRGAEYSFDILGEDVVSEAEAEQYTQGYLDLISVLSRLALPVDLSLKLSSLYSQLSPLCGEVQKEEVKKRLRQIARRARENRGGITIDAEHLSLRSITWDIVKEFLTEEEFSSFPGFAIAHQTYFTDSQEVLYEIIRFAKACNSSLGIRLVKGAYWDHEVITALQKNWPVPVYQKREQTDASFEASVDLCLEHYPPVRTAVGSHNLSSIAYAMAKQQSLRLPKHALEFQVLYGLGDPLVRPIHTMGYPVRVYVGIGDPVVGMGYLARRLLENTSQTSSAFFAEE